VTEVVKALILDSGIGTRMGAFADSHHKSMALLANGETLLFRQLRILREAGIREFVITTGPFAEQLVETTKSPRFADCRFQFVPNPRYAETNYIVSMYLATDYLAGNDVLLLHGDLVFDRYFAKKLIAHAGTIAAVNRDSSQPEKDFKARITGTRIREIAVDIFDDDCCAFQPFYKLTKEAVSCWLERVAEFVRAGKETVYAEDALNELLLDGSIELEALSYRGHFVSEIDSLSDLSMVSTKIRSFDFAQQPVIEGEDAATSLLRLFDAEGIRKPLFVCGSVPERSGLSESLIQRGIPWMPFKSFSTPPTYSDVQKACAVFKTDNFDAIVSIGGGSAIDVAKCVKLLAGTELKDELPKQTTEPLDVLHIAVPTTAGTGSEATRFAVIYQKGKKQSITHDALIPDYAILDSGLLASLPDPQKKTTLLDALTQCIESFWSVNSTEQSKKYASEGIRLILDTTDAYLAGDAAAARKMLKASCCSGKAINISQTTASHAMSYKLTSLLNVPHGAAVALTLPNVWYYLIENYDKCTDSRGVPYLKDTMAELTSLFGASADRDAVAAFEMFYRKLEMPLVILEDGAEIEKLASSVNIQRLKNFPVMVSKEAIADIYQKSLSGKGNCHEKHP
jgi:alcohol dehydrogenase class IV/choline kinase